jgi:hypothetical protein
MQAKQQLNPGSPKGEKRAVAPGRRPTGHGMPSGRYVCRGRPLLHPSLACILRDSANTERDVILASGEQAGIMAQRKKRPTARRGKSALAKAKPKRAKAKKVAGRRKPMKPPSTPAVETGIVDVIEEPASGAIVVTEAEATEVREPSAGPEQPKGRDQSEES